MRIAVEVFVKSEITSVWKAWNTPEDIMQWNAASGDWHTTSSKVDLREGGKFISRMEAKDGSMGFDFSGMYTKVIAYRLIEYKMEDERLVNIDFIEDENGVKVIETFDPESENTHERQRAGWQSILNNFARYVESKGK